MMLADSVCQWIHHFLVHPPPPVFATGKTNIAHLQLLDGGFKSLALEKNVFLRIDGQLQNVKGESNKKTRIKPEISLASNWLR